MTDQDLLPNKPAKKLSDIAAKHAFGMGCIVYKTQLVPAIKCEEVTQNAGVFIRDLLEMMKPRDPFEEMLVLQAAWTHARLARLSTLATHEYNPDAIRIKNEACDRAANTFRKQMLTLAEYRKPHRSDPSITIQQANMAQHQVIQQVEHKISKPSIESNEKGLLKVQAKELPAHSSGPIIPAGIRRQGEAVAADDRPANGGRQGAV